MVRIMLFAGVAGALLACDPVSAQSSPPRDTLRLEVGSPRVDGRVYKPHKALVRVRIGDADSPVLREWTNELTLGDSAGRPVMRWVTIGRQNAGPNAGGSWELRQTYDAITLRPLAYNSAQANGAYTRLTMEGNSAKGFRRGPSDAAETPIEMSFDRPGFFAGASDLVPAAVGFRRGLVMTAPVWSPNMQKAETRIFSVIGEEKIDVEGASVVAWKVEERMTDGTLYATWWLLDRSPYMVYGEIPLPDGRIQRMTEVEVGR